MSVLIDSNELCAFCDGDAEFHCDHCGRPMCGACMAEPDDPDCPNELCDECI